MFFYVIGNGFDLHYHLQTSYCHFKNFLLNNGYESIVNSVDRLFKDKGDFSPSEIEYWSDFENMLLVFNHLDAEEMYDDAMSNAEPDDERADYLDSPSRNVDYYHEYIRILKEQFDVWIRQIDTRIIPDRYFLPQKHDRILTFNYTTTIEDNFPDAGYDILHIHGTKDEEIILGHNEYQEPETFIVYEDMDSDYRDLTTKKAINGILEKVADLYYKNCSEMLQRYKTVFSSISQYEKVVIMGLSCGDQDIEYVKTIISFANHIDFYYYPDKDGNSEAKDRFAELVDGKNVAINYYSW